MNNKTIKKCVHQKELPSYYKSCSLVTRDESLGRNKSGPIWVFHALTTAQFIDCSRLGQTAVQFTSIHLQDFLTWSWRKFSLCLVAKLQDLRQVCWGSCWQSCSLLWGSYAERMKPPARRSRGLPLSSSYIPAATVRRRGVSVIRRRVLAEIPPHINPSSKVMLPSPAK
jgi:hypothetical protein